MRVQRVQKIQRGRPKGAKGRGWRRRLCRGVVKRKVLKIDRPYGPEGS